MWVITFSLLGVLVVLAVRALNNQREILRDWQTVLSPEGVDLYGELEQRVKGESRMAEYAFQRAFNARATGSPEEAIRLLAVGLGLVERTSPEMVTLLRRMAIASRMAAALAPVDALTPADFRLRRLSHLAVLDSLLHRLHFSAAERFRLRTYLLRQGFGTLRRLLSESTQRIRTRHENADSEWDRIAVARADLLTLSMKSLQTFHTLLISLLAEPR